MKKIILIDSYGFFYKTHYAFSNNPLTTSQGEITSIVFSFLTNLFKLCQKEPQAKVICILDSKGPTFRKKLYSDYKANRPPMPDELKEQIIKIKFLLNLLGIPMVYKTSFEADDIIAHYAQVVNKSTDYILTIFSSDKDLFQLVNDKINVITTDRKTNDFLIFNREKIKEKLNVFPEQVVDYLSLLGDKADNIPGVAGVGKVTAEKIIKQFNNIENLYENLNQAKLSETMKKKIIAGRENAFLSKKLIKLNKLIDNIPPLEEINFSPIQVKALIEELKKLEFNSLLKKFASLSEKPAISLQQFFNQSFPLANQEKVDEKKFSEKFNRQDLEITNLDLLIKKIEKEKLFIFDLETTDLNPFVAKIVAMVLVFSDFTSFYFKLTEEQLVNSNYEKFLKKLKPAFENPEIKKVGHNLKFEYSILKAQGITLQGIYFDTMIAEYLIDPDKNQFNLEDTIFNYFSYKKKKFKEIMKGLDSIWEIENDCLRNYTYQDGEFTFLIYQEQQKKLSPTQLTLLKELEFPFLEVLGEMENYGVLLNPKILKSLETELTFKIKKVEKEIYSLAQEKFNLNSTKQLQTILFEKMGINPIKKMKTGFSTDNFVLEKLSSQYLIAQELLKYRKYNKLLSTYILALPKLISPFTQRVHTNYNQTVASTGRLSSNNPNLQNIPVGEENHGIRQAFIAPPHYDLVSLDYSQVELRILAWLAQEEVFLNAYKNNIDIHKKTATFLFQKELEEISKEERNIAKTINFSVIYGISAHALGEDLKISFTEANHFIQAFFSNYPQIKIYQEKILNLARSQGYVETYYKRKRFVPHITSNQFFLKSRAERIAFNTVIQGTASDIIKKAMLAIHQKIKQNLIEAQMVMQVHDELVFYIKKKKVNEMIKKLKYELVNITPFHQVLQVNETIGNNWNK